MRGASRGNRECRRIAEQPNRTAKQSKRIVRQPKRIAEQVNEDELTSG
jgi:hypothetical protein